jgi:UDP-N-acetylmuramoylalanine--D-glutamate ligase
MRLPAESLKLLRELVSEPVEIVGGGVEGQSTARFLLGAGFERVTLRDRDPDITVPEGCDRRCGADYLFGLPAKGTVVRSAGVRSDLPELAEFASRGGQILSQLPIFLALYQGSLGGRVVGITGTFGKGTVTTLLSGMLHVAGIEHVVGGNIGTPMLDLLLQDPVPETALLELSSFQLSDLAAPRSLPAGLKREDFCPRVGVSGRVTIEHLDWHRDQIEYWNAKARLCEEQSDTDHAVFLSSDPGSVFVGMAGSGILHSVGEAGELVPGTDAIRDGEGQILLHRSEMKVPGAFQLVNTSLAWVAARILGASDEACRSGAIGFVGLPHRLQFSGEKDGVRFYNDSYATRPEATLAALEAVSDRSVALILGGSDKGIEFDALAQGLKAARNLKFVALIGATAPPLRKALERDGRPHFLLIDFPHLPEAFEACRKAMTGGGNVLLSPACASFGLFKNYKERGEAFLALTKSVVG